MTIREYLEIQYLLARRLLSCARQPKPREVTEAFTRRYYDLGSAGATWFNTRWFGCRTLKCPLDLWVYQEIVFETKPSLIVETGTFEGGSALFLAHLLDLVGLGQVISIDTRNRPNYPRHPRITYWAGSSIETRVVEAVQRRASSEAGVMVILDSDHHKEHVRRELELYSPLVGVGHYLIVEDTSLDRLQPEFGPGPMEAAEEFLEQHPNFEVDRSREKFLMTFNPKGFLKRMA